MTVTSVFFKEAITWPATQYSGVVSMDIGKPGLREMYIADDNSGVFIKFENKVGQYTTFVPMANIKCVNLAEDVLGE